MPILPPPPGPAILPSTGSNLFYPRIIGAMDWEVTFAPLYHTLAQEAVSGREVRIPLRFYPRWEITVKYVLLRNAANERDETGFTPLEKLVNFFGMMKGGADSFLLNLTDLTHRDEDSNVAGQLIGVGDGTSTNFQLFRYILGLLDIVQATGMDDSFNQVVQVYDNNSPLIQNTDYTVTNGIVQFAAPPNVGHLISADFTAYWRCRFNTSEAVSKRSALSFDLGFRQFLPNKFDHTKEICMVTVIDGGSFAPGLGFATPPSAWAGPGFGPSAYAPWRRYRSGDGLTGAINGVNTIFTIPIITPNPVTVLVIWNGQLLSAGIGYTLVGNTFTMAIAPGSGDILEIYA